MGDLRTVITLTALAMLVEFAVAANITVGGPNGGWDQSTILQSWASSQTFKVGDNLVFQYTALHTVLEVTKSDYDSCQGNRPLQAYNDGSTVVPLSSPGKRYFICGTSGHCSQGMKLAVDTIAASVPSTSPTPSPSVKAPTPSPSKAFPPASPAEQTSPTSSAFPPSESSPNPRGTAPVPSPSAAYGRCSPTKLALGFGFGLVMLLSY
ncbi:uclacyanin 1 [Aristolochia californica]|uniref:uclacyanin 1 n=1 Tax=Aristolochia californica TaxID=171875 RepID=UPI0035D6EBB5